MKRTIQRRNKQPRVGQEKGEMETQYQQQAAEHMLETYCMPGLYLSSFSEQLSRADARLGGGARAA